MKYLLFIAFFLPLYGMAQTNTVDFEMLEDTITNTKEDFESNKAYKEFELKGITPIKCAIKLVEEDVALLSQYYESRWQVIDTLYYVTGLGQAFEISDFDKDGNEDFMLRALVNMHSNAGYSIYLNSPDQNKLVILEETTDDGWSNPDYDPKKKIITCETLGGMYGDYSISTYRLENLKAIPLYKKETDYTNFEEPAGKGGFYREYIGDNGVWKLTKEKKSKPKK